MNELKHIAIIMDGNGRWAKQRGFMKRIIGHEEGAKRVRELTIHASNIGVKYLTLYAFSTENWKRPEGEGSFLMQLMDRYLKNELKLFLENNVRFETIGNIDALPQSLRERIAYTKERTAHFTGLTQVLAVNYGSRDEIVRAANKAVELGKKVDEKSFEMLLDTAGMDPVDILIRTGGDKRLSNYLLWQAAYSELYFTETLWPDFTVEKLDEIIAHFQTVERRFGAVK
ncbi:MAG TPA: di-trans,poly-cis-decaprenylcistransferase [Campylobacteraceae bacterium]|nr:di-trans,poly-cis-decaprenylcistransferase [Campylobacteraceae bacterium]